jgi:ABC-type transporter Mla subunit MlaD
MPAERNAFKLGLTLLLLFVLFWGVIWFLAPRGGGDLVLQVRYPHEQFATPLKSGGEVMCGGKTVGSVQRLDLRELMDENTGYTGCYAVVTFKIDSSVGLRRDARIEPTEALLGGMAALVVRDRGLGEPAKAGDLLDGQPAMGITDLTGLLGRQLDPRNPTGLLAMVSTQLDAADSRSLLGKVHKSLDDINVLTRNIAGESNAGEKTALLAKLHEILNHVNETTASLREQMDVRTNTAAVARLHAVLDSLNAGLATVQGMLDENREPIRGTIRHVEATSRILEQQIAARLAEQLDTSNAAGLLARIHLAIDKLGRSVEDVNSITGDVRDVIALNKGNIDATIGNLKETSDHLKAGSKEIRLNPWLLLYTPTQNETAQANLFGTARAFTEAATRLDDAIARLEVISRHGKPEAPGHRDEVERIRAQLDETFRKFTEIELKLWEQLNIK